MVQFSSMLVGMVLIAAIISGVLIFAADGSLQYGKSDIDNTSMVRVIDSYNDLNRTSYEVKDNLLKITSSQTSVVDKLGAFFEGGYSGAKIMVQSFTSMLVITDAVTADSSLLLGGYAGLLKGFLLTAIIIIITVAIIMHFLIKSDRL